MKKKIFILGFTLIALNLNAISQELFITRTGEISFFSSTPVEDIEAENKSVTCIFKPGSGELAFKLFMKSFAFERAAMQEHFNNDYVHSDEFPKSSFEGKATGAEKMDIRSEGKHNVEVKGELTIHGISQPVEEAGTLEVTNGKIILSSVFDVSLDDYDVKIPGNFVHKISRNIEISVNAVLEPYER